MGPLGNKVNNPHGRLLDDTQHFRRVLRLRRRARLDEGHITLVTETTKKFVIPRKHQVRWFDIMDKEQALHPPCHQRLHTLIDQGG